MNSYRQIHPKRAYNTGLGPSRLFRAHEGKLRQMSHYILKWSLKAQKWLVKISSLQILFYTYKNMLNKYIWTVFVQLHCKQNFCCWNRDFRCSHVISMFLTYWQIFFAWIENTICLLQNMQNEEFLQCSFYKIYMFIHFSIFLKQLPSAPWWSFFYFY